ncbi:MAG: hypothetical protein IKI77_12585 [Oscillospiraceae bacterium]|nr:hypothetical protein [Oscillospiraceae bacterium]
MYQEDYIIRKIQMLGRAIARFVFRKDVESPADMQLENAEKREKTNSLLRMIDCGKIRDAEKELHRMSEDKTMDDLVAGIRFYSYLGEQSEAFLDDHGYNDVDLKLGLRQFADRFGSKHLADMMMQ